MRNKIIGIFVVTLLIGTAVLPLVSSADKRDISHIFDESPVDEDYICSSNNLVFNDFSIMSDPLVPSFINDDTPKKIIVDLLDNFNWMNHNGQDWTTPVKNQGNCGSCWIFAALGALESVIEIQENLSDLNPDLSEQYILSCLPMAANVYGKGCSYGGDPYNAYKYINATNEYGNGCNGVPLEVCMPYQADETVDCEQKSADWEQYLVPITDYGNYWWENHNESTLNQIKTRIIERGPVVTGMNVTNDFTIWGSLNHDPTDYYPDPQEEWAEWLNHIVVIVGWKDDPSIGNGGYWICKNSWGTSWGYDGFFNIEYGSLFTGWYTAWVEYDPESYEWPDNYNSPYIVNIDGPTNGKKGDEYEYTFIATDPNELDLFYFIQWGDGEIEEWIGPFDSNSEMKINHTWNKRGSFIVTAMVKNTDNIGSQWSTLEVSMPKNKPINPFLQFLENHPHLFPLLRQLLELK